MRACGDGRVWRIRVRGAMSATVVEALPEVAVVETGPTTLVETGPTTLVETHGALGDTIDHLQTFGLEVVEVHESRAPTTT